MSFPTNSPHIFTCPNCGAPLSIEDDNEQNIHCQYCRTVSENPDYQPPQPEIHVVLEPPVQVKPQKYSPPPRRSGCALSAVIIFLLFAIFVAGGGALLAINITSRISEGTFVPPLPAIFPLQIESRYALLLPSDRAAPNLIAETYDVTGQSYAISRLDLANHTALWSALGQKDYMLFDALLAGDTYLYLVIKNRLIALQLSDGQKAWETSLSDELAGACRRCIILKDDRLLVLSTDHTLGAYDALTGHQVWEKRFDNAGYTLHPLQHGVALAYSINRGAALGIFDISTGNERMHLEPACRPPDGMQDEMEVYSNVLIDETGPSAKAYTFFGLFNACVQRWDLSSGSMDWQYIDEDNRLGNVSDTPVLLADDRLYLIFGDQLRSLNAAAGQPVQILDETKDYRLVPLLADGQRLVVRAQRTRGTTRYELWAYDLSSGKNLWKHPIVKGSPIDPPGEMSGLITSDEPGWTLLQAPGSLWLITLQTQPNQVNLARVNLDTGEWTDQKSLLLGLDNSTEDYGIPVRIDSRDHLAWFAMVNRIYAVDPAADTFPYRWP